MKVQLQACKTDVNSPLTPWLEVKNCEMESLKMEAAGFLRHYWKAAELLTPDLHQICV